MVIRFLIVSLSFYGMSTFEGSLLSIKTMNALSHEPLETGTDLATPQGQSFLVISD